MLAPGARSEISALPEVALRLLARLRAVLDPALVEPGPGIAMTSELDIFVGNTTLIDEDVYRLWLDGYSGLCSALPGSGCFGWERGRGQDLGWESGMEIFGARGPGGPLGTAVWDLMLVPSP